MIDESNLFKSCPAWEGLCNKINDIFVEFVICKNSLYIWRKKRSDPNISQLFYILFVDYCLIMLLFMVAFSHRNTTYAYISMSPLFILLRASGDMIFDENK